jgi:hypothetical protein
VGPRAGLDVCKKFRPPPGFDPRTVQPVASRPQFWGIPMNYTKPELAIKFLKQSWSYKTMCTLLHISVWANVFCSAINVSILTAIKAHANKVKTKATMLKNITDMTVYFF